jgi:hypothetical protein
MTNKEFDNLKVGDFVEALEDSDHVIYEALKKGKIYRVTEKIKEYLMVTSNFSDISNCTTGWESVHFKSIKSTKLGRILYL